MIRKILEKLEWKDNPNKSEDNAAKTTYLNNSQSLNNNEEPTRKSLPVDGNNSSETTNSKTENVKERQISVFISSTFKDMQAERDELVKKCFPQLRKLCEERDVTWGEVDLRWGITDEQKAEGKVLPICLEEIERCRPYFIGILGERYGWVDDDIPASVLEKYDWLKEYKGKSVTELEILHGVLRDPDMADHAFFYFRDSVYLNSIDETERINYIEAPTEADIKKYGHEEALKIANEKKNKLAELKKSIRDSGFPVSENYVNPKTVGELVFRDLKNVIDTLYPEEKKLDHLEQARLDHEAFAKNRFKVYIERKEYFDRFDAHVRDNGLPLVLIGDSGSGKSALLANWARKYREKQADELFLFVHYIGATPDSVDLASLLRRIMEEMKFNLGIKRDIPDKPDELKEAFPNWLNMAAAKGMIIIIDALNQLEDRDGALELFWLPEKIPQKVRLIVSTLPGRSLDELNKRGWPTMKVEPLDVEERKKLIEDYLKQYSRNLSRGMVDHIASHSQVSNPLYLRVLLEEMRLYGDNKTLLQRTDHYLAAFSVADLYDKVLERYEQDYDENRKNLVKDSFSYLWAARKGLSQIEIRELLGSNGKPLPGAFWSPLYLAAEKSLVNRSGLLNFAHEYVRNAVKKRYLKTESEEQHYHLHLANYFEKGELGKRNIEELPWQLAQAKSWNKLADLLTLPSSFEMAWNSNEFDLKGYWMLIEKNSELRIVDVYRLIIRSIIDSSSKYDSGFVSALFMFFHDTGHYDEAQSLMSYVIADSKTTGNKDLLQASMGNQANVFYNLGNMKRALEVYQNQEMICREIGNKDGLLKSLGNQALILKLQGNLDDATKLHKMEERICKELDNTDGLQASLGNQALVLKARGDMDGAMKLLKEKERICEEIGNKDGVQASVGNQATILYLRDDLNGAMELLKKQQRICMELGNKNGLQASLGNQALILANEGDLDGSMQLLKEQEEICIKLNHKEGLQKSLGNQSVILKYKGDLEGAIKLLKEQERICRELGNKEDLQRSLGNQALIMEARVNQNNFMKLLRNQEMVCIETVCKHLWSIKR